MGADNGQFTIDLHDVAKTYRGKVQALCGVEMQVHRGEIFGLLGPNGAGKSTLVKILMTVVRPTRIRGTMLGQPVGHKATLARVGYLPEHHRIPPYLTGRQALGFYAALANVDRRTRRLRAGRLLESVGMNDWANRRVSSYSKGMMQRVGLAQALMNDPELLLLDEPTDGVDPVGRRDIRDQLLALRKRGTTVFINSHLLSELEMVCDRVAILVQGQVAMQGTIDDLTAQSQRYEITLRGLPPESITGNEAVRVEPVQGGGGESRVILQTANAADAQPVIDQLRAADCTIISVRPVRETLEDLFMRAVEDPQTHRARPVGAHMPAFPREKPQEMAAP